MTTAQFDSQKIEQLLNAATSERQRKMYQALLEKAQKQERSSTKNKRAETISSTEKTAQTKTKSSTKTQKKTKTVKKNQKVATQSTSTEASTTTKQSSQTLTESSPLPPTSAEPAPSTIEPAPQTESKSQSKKKKKKQPATQTPRFQALGTVIATPYFQDERSYLKINGDEYKLLPVGGKRYQSYIKLKKELEKNGSSPMFLRVYPKATFDYQTQQPRLAFSLVNFSRNCEKINLEEMLKHYFPDLSPQTDGSHLSRTWKIVTHLFQFFPWYDTSSSARLNIPTPTIEVLQAIFLDYLKAGKGYANAYIAAM